MNEIENELMEVVRDTNQRIPIMKSIRTYLAFLVAATAVFALSFFIGSSSKKSQTEIESEMPPFSRETLFKYSRLGLFGFFPDYKWQ